MKIKLNDEVKITGETLKGMNSVGNIGIVTEIDSKDKTCRVSVDGQVDIGNWSKIKDVKLLTKTKKMNKHKKFIKDAYNGKLGLTMCSDWKEAIEKEYPEFKEVKKGLEINKWYKWEGINKAIGYISKPATHNSGTCYEFDYLTSGKTDSFNSLKDTYLVPATDQEVKEALIKEAKRRGFKEGVKISFTSMSGENTIDKYDFGNILYLSSTNRLAFGNKIIFDNGKWTEIIETISKEEAEKLIGKKII